MLLKYVAKRARRLGDFVQFPSYSSNGNNVEQVSNTLEALAWSECASSDELRFLFEFLVKREFI